MNYRDNCTIIEVGSSCVKKTYLGAGRQSRVLFLRSIYLLLVEKTVPNVDKLYSILRRSSGSWISRVRRAERCERISNIGTGSPGGRSVYSSSTRSMSMPVRALSYTDPS